MNDGTRPAEEPADESDFETARDILSGIIAEYSRLIGRETNPQVRRRLLQKQLGYSRQRRDLRIDDHERVRAVNRDYPAVLRQVREGHP